MKEIVFGIFWFIFLFAVICSVFGFISGCISYWMRDPWDKDVSFKKYFWGGILDVLKIYARRIITYVGLAILCGILSLLFFK